MDVSRLGVTAGEQASSLTHRMWQESGWREVETLASVSSMPSALPRYVVNYEIAWQLPRTNGKAAR